MGGSPVWCGNGRWDRYTFAEIPILVKGLVIFDNFGNRGIVGYAEVDPNSVYRYEEYPSETSNSPIDHPHILTVKYIVYVKNVGERIPFKNIKELLGITPQHLRHTIAECNPKQYKDVKSLVGKLGIPRGSNIDDLPGPK